MRAGAVALRHHLPGPTVVALGALGGNETRRGRILIMGGDEVYPLASTVTA